MSDISKAAVADVRIMMRNIRDRRVHLGLSMAHVADAVGVAQATYAEWESGGAFPSSRGIAAACRAVGLRIAVAHAEPVEELADHASPATGGAR